MKKLLCIVLIFSMVFSSFAYIFAEDDFLLSNELVGAMQPNHNIQCTAYAGAYLIRRRAAIEYSKDVALQDSLSMDKVINSLWAGGGIANSASVNFYDNSGQLKTYTLTGYDLYNRKEIGSRSTRQSIIDMADNDQNIKLITDGGYISHGGGETDSKKVKELLIYLLSIHPEGIVIWVYRDASHQHAVLLTNYDANTDNFYCVDPAYRTVTGGYSFKGWVTDSWLGYQQGTVGSRNLDTILKYVISLWMIWSPIDTTTEDDVINKYPLYLLNDQFDTNIGHAISAGNDILSSIGGYEEACALIATFGTGMFKSIKNGLKDSFARLIGNPNLSKTTDDTYSYDVAKHILRYFASNEAGIKTSEKLSSDFKLISSVDKLTQKSIDQIFSKLNSSGHNELTKSEFDKIGNKVLGMQMAGGTLSVAGKTVKAANVLVGACELYSTEIRNIKFLMNRISQDSYLYRGLQLILNDRKASPATYVIDNYLTGKALDKLIELCASAVIGGVPYAIFSALFDIINIAYEGPTMDELIKAYRYYSSVLEISMAYGDCRMNIIKGIGDDDAETLKLLHELYIYSIKTYLSHCTTLVMPYKEYYKTAAKQMINSIDSGYLSYDVYIGSCVLNLRKDIANGTVMSYVHDHTVSIVENNDGTYKAVCGVTGCNYEWPMSVTRSNNESETIGVGTYIILDSDVEICNSPYKQGFTGNYYRQGSVVTVIGVCSNAYNNIWYKTDKGEWFNAWWFDKNGNKIVTPITKIAPLEVIQAPILTNAEYIGNNSVEVSWSGVSKAEYYELQYCGTNDNVWKDETSYRDQTSTSCISTNWLASATQYRFRVRACNSYEASEWVYFSCLKNDQPSSGESPKVPDKPTYTVEDKEPYGKQLVVNHAGELSWRFSSDSVIYTDGDTSDENKTDTIIDLDSSCSITLFCTLDKTNSDSLSVDIDVPVCDAPGVECESTAEGYLVSIEEKDNEQYQYKINGKEYEYTEPFIVDENCSIVFYAMKPGYAFSSVTKEYDVDGLFTLSDWYTSEEIEQFKKNGIIDNNIRIFGKEFYSYTVQERDIEYDQLVGYEEDTVYTDFGEWSEWSSEKRQNEYDSYGVLISEVQTKEGDPIPSHKEYRYGRWQWGDENTFCPSVGQYNFGVDTVWSIAYTDWMDEPYQKAPNGKGYNVVFYHQYGYYPAYTHEHIGAFEGSQDNWYENGYNWFCYSVDGSTDKDKRYFWEEVTDVPEMPTTLYSYRERTAVPCYSKWNDVEQTDLFDERQSFIDSGDCRYIENIEYRYCFNLDSDKVLNRTYIENYDGDNESFMTRAQFCRKLIDLNIISYNSRIMNNISFEDIPADSDLYEAFCAAKYYRILNGDENNKMHPQEQISRAELASVLCKLIPSLHTDYASIVPKDVYSSTWYYKNVMNVLDFNLMKTDEINLFKPDEFAKISDVSWIDLVDALGRKNDYLIGDLRICNCSNGTVKSGDIFDLDFVIDNNPGIIGMQYSVNYDPLKFELVTVSGIEGFGRFSFNSDLGVRPFEMVWDNAYSSENVLSTGCAAKLQFRAIDATSAGSYQISLNATNAFNTELDNVYCLSSGVTINVQPFVHGDIDGNDGVTTDDATYILKYLVKQSGYTNPEYIEAGDVDGDGKISVSDVVVILRHIAEWDGYESLPLSKKV